ncbi:MAG: ScaI family restriction endonuclease, partial [Candidatus Coatesbacteria bacterium]|nr:ScaI family restriction endonuclease [Candidatus Coatesbacteria bacterium]
FFHTAFGYLLEEKHPDQWRKGEKDDKDIICIDDDRLSFEIKTSSSINRIYANRSYGQQEVKGRKSKDGYYLAVNFTKVQDLTEETYSSGVRLVRFGWLEHTDWKPQRSSTGQQSHLEPETYDLKFVTLYQE